jgi:hypothetical protein
LDFWTPGGGPHLIGPKVFSAGLWHAIFLRRLPSESRLQASISGQDFWTFGEKLSGPKVAMRILSEARGASARLNLEMSKSGLARVSLKCNVRHPEPFAPLRVNSAKDLAPGIAHHIRSAGRSGKLFLTTPHRLAGPTAALAFLFSQRYTGARSRSHGRKQTDCPNSAY